MNKKNQVTFFIIIAVLILAIFVISMIVLSRMSKKQMENPPAVVKSTAVEYQEFHSYMQACFDNALKEALFILGRQGGFFFNGQPGSIVDFGINASEVRSTSRGKEMFFNVTYVNEEGIHPKLMTIPYYPCFNSQYVDPVNGPPSELVGFACIYNYTYLMPGTDLIPWSRYQKVGHAIRDVKVPLCSEDQITNVSGAVRIVCRTSHESIKQKYSVQNQTEEYIKYELQQCYDTAESFITDQMDAVVESKGDFDVEVIYSDLYTAATMRFPLVLSFEKRDSSSQSFEFYTKANVRLGTIYAILYGQGISVKDNVTGQFNDIKKGILESDFYNLTFDINADSSELFMKYNIYDIKVSREQRGKESLIKVVDERSELYTEPYEYYVKMWNRVPALDYIRLNQVNEYDHYAYAGETFLIAPIAFDLDDEGKESHPLYYRYELDDNWKWREQYFSNNSLFKYGRDGETVCLHSKYGVTKHRCTKIILNDSDVGIHNMTVFVEDAGGKYDSQDLKILVDRVSNLSFRIHNIYPDIPDELPVCGNSYIVSPEDPFILNATDSVFSIGPFSRQLWWEDKKYGRMDIIFQSTPPAKSLFDPEKENFRENIFPYRFFITNLTLVHPGFRNFTNLSFLQDYLEEAELYNTNLGENADVMDLWDALEEYRDEGFDINYRRGYPISPVGVTTAERNSYITLVFDAGQRITRQKPIFIAECIPHYSETPSYPYSLLRTVDRDINPYMANHTCCRGVALDAANWRVAPAGTICYNTEEVSGYVEFMMTPQTNISTDLFGKLNTEFLIPWDPVEAANDDYDTTPRVLPPEDIGFDLYARKLVGKCDGERGNVCWPQEFSIKKIPYCGYNYSYDFPMDSNMFNNTIWNTSMIDAPNDDLYVNDERCICRDRGKTRIMNKSNTTIDPFYGIEHNQLRCCFNGYDVPSRLTNTSCVLTECAKYWTRDPIYQVTTPPPPPPPTISSTVFDITDNNKLPPFCKCGTKIVNATEKASWYCCDPVNPGLFNLKEFEADCII